jgi:tellurite resistance protein
MRPAQEALLSLVDRIFADGVVTPAERSELVSLYRGAGLTVAEVREVFTAFVAKTWGDALSDGVFSDDERDKLVLIARELKLPKDCMPEIVAQIVAAA